MTNPSHHLVRRCSQAALSFITLNPPPGGALVDQTINVTTAAPASALYGTTFPVAATATSGLGVTISGSGACSGSGTNSATITMTAGTGTCTVSYTQSGNGAFNPAPQVQNTTIATPINLTVTNATVSNRTYDGTTTATVTANGTLTGLINGDVVTLTGTPSGTFADKNVGTGKTVTVTGLTLYSADADALNYSLVSVTGTANITTRPITVTAATNTKTYDGGTSATALPTITSGTLAAGDTAGFSESYSTKTVGAGKTLVPGGSVTDGNGGANYAVTFANNTTGVITAKTLTVSGYTASNKTYDGTTTATVTGGSLSGVVGGDTVTVGTYTAAFSDKNAATGKTVTISGLTLGGADAGNYTVGAIAGTTATITAKNLTMSGLSVPTSKVYDGSTTAVVSGTAALQAAEAPGTGTASDGNPYTGDTVSITGTATGTYNSKDVATATTVTYGGLSLAGAEAGNYALTIQNPASATITARNLTVSGITANNKPYDATTTAALNVGSAALVGNLDGGNVVLNTGSAAGAFTPDGTVGTGKTVQVSGLTISGSASGNYTLTQPTTTADITKATPNVTTWPTASAITYGQTLASSTLSGGVATPVGSFAFTTPATAPNAGTAAQSVTYTPTDTTNYNTAISTVNVTVNKATPTATLAVGNSPQTYTGLAQAASVSISASSVPGAVANSLTGGAATQTNANTYAVTADFVPTDSANYNTLTGLSAGNFVINPAFQSIFFGPLADKNLGDTVTVSASATSTLAVSFASQTPLVCTTGGAYGSDVTLVTIGTCTIQATQGGNGNFNAALPVDQSFTVNPGTIDHFAFSAITTPQTAGTAFSVTITAQDAGNNTVTGFTGTANLTTTAGTINPTATPAFVNGIWTGSVTVTGAGTAKTISATDPVSSKAGTSGAFDVNPAAAAGFSVTGPPSATAGSAISVTVTAKDTYNNIATGYLGTIHFTSTDTHIGMALPADFTFQASDNGSHTFTGEVTLETAGTQTVTATDTTVPAIFGISNSIAVSPAGAAKLLVTAPPTATAGTAFSVTVEVRDIYDNTITDYAGTVRFTSSDPNVTKVLPADYTFVGSDNGLHTFTNLTNLKTSGTQTVTATDTVTPSITGTSGSINVSAGTATQVAVETAADGSGTVVGTQSVTTGVSVTGYAVTRDAEGNFVANVAADAWLLPTKTDGVVDGDLVASGDNKSATFTGHLVGTATIRATSGALTTVDSGLLTVTTSALHHFAIAAIGTQTR